MSKIIDCFIFYNELDLLKYRLNILNSVVDYFIIVESTHTFVGKEKPLFFEMNKHLFTEFMEKIIHIIVDDLPYKYPNINTNNNDYHTSDVWLNEIFQRNAISRGISHIRDISNSDMIIIADVDEIPDPNTLTRIKEEYILVDINILEMDMYYYNLNTKNTNKWTYCKIMTYKKYRVLNLSCDCIRNNMHYTHISNGGWHLSYFGDKHFIQNKIKNFSHQELNIDQFTDLEKIDERIVNKTDLYDRVNIEFKNIKSEDNPYLPLEYHKYLNKFFS